MRILLTGLAEPPYGLLTTGVLTNDAGAVGFADRRRVWDDSPGFGQTPKAGRVRAEVLPRRQDVQKDIRIDENLQGSRASLSDNAS